MCVCEDIPVTFSDVISSAYVAHRRAKFSITFESFCDKFYPYSELVLYNYLKHTYYIQSETLHEWKALRISPPRHGTKILNRSYERRL